ncbi:MAG: hypothetical protein FWE02_03715 [Defluviitaleaceae bacterium]|nr:hypothetical protein [Defluviitaleaceae bacterium]
MGMFNTIKIKCMKCNEIIEHQSKSGSCNLETFELHEAPLADLASLDNSMICTKCNTEHTIHIDIIASYWIEGEK